MAVFLLRSRNGPAVVPAAATGTVFDDVPAGAFAAAWIERLAADEVLEPGLRVGACVRRAHGAAAHETDGLADLAAGHALGGGQDHRFTSR